jgi:DNA-binding response OmpR family regulator
MRILLIDDSEDTGQLVQRCLAAYEVTQAFSLKDALDKIASFQYDLLLIDVSLPDGNGFAFCESLSTDERLQNVPKIFLSAHAATSDKVYGLNCGADDYITKPFEVAELRARVDVRLRQTRSAPADATYEGFTFHRDFQRCTYLDAKGTIDLNLTPTEFRLLLALAKAAGKPLTRQEMVRDVWTNNGMNIEKRGIDSHIAHLRKKLPAGSAEIVSVYGKGYALIKNSEPHLKTGAG